MASIYARIRRPHRCTRRQVLPTSRHAFPVGSILVNRNPETDAGTGLSTSPNHSWRVIWADEAERYLASDATGALLVRSVRAIRSGFQAREIEA